MNSIPEKVYTHYTEISSNAEENDNLPEDIKKVKVKDIRKSLGFEINRYSKLVKCVAELGNLNPYFNLLYRGQEKDHTNKFGSTIYPKILRPISNKRLITDKEKDRFIKLFENCEKLRDNKKKISLPNQKKGLLSYSEYYYAILQHYEICPTPLIDLTQSLRVAANFALQGDKEGYVLVLGMPHPHGSISHFIDQEMTLIKLQNVCSPDAWRPHYQEGYLAGNLPFDSKLRFGYNLARRLIGKYHLDGSDGKFWDKGFSKFPTEVLYPENDPFEKRLNEILGKK